MLTVCSFFSVIRWYPKYRRCLVLFCCFLSEGPEGNWNLPNLVTGKMGFGPLGLGSTNKKMEMGFRRKIDWEMGSGQNLGWEMRFGLKE